MKKNLLKKKLKMTIKNCPNALKATRIRAYNYSYLCI